MPTLSTHPRADIRQYVVAALLGNTSAGARVYSTRAIPHKKLELPAIAVYTSSESAEQFDSAPLELKRSLELTIEAAVKQNDNIDDEMDIICREIEKVMQADRFLGGAAGLCLISGTSLEVSDDGERLVGLAKLTYDVVYMTNVPFPDDLTLPDATGASITYDLGNAQQTPDPENPDPGDPAQDTVDLT